MRTFWPFIYSSKNSNRLKMYAATALDVIATTINVGTPVLVVDYAHHHPNPGEDESDYNTYLPIIAGVFLMSQVLPKIRNMLHDSVRANVQKELTMAIVNKSYEIELDTMLTTPTGDFSQTLFKSYTTIDKIIPSFFSEILPVVMETAGSTVALTSLYGLTGVGMSQATIMGVYLFAQLVRESGSRELREACDDRSREAYGAILTAIEKYQIAHQFGNTQYELDKVQEILSQSEILFRQNHHRNDLSALIGSLISTIGTVGVLSLAALQPPTDNFDSIDFWLVAYLMIRFNTNLENLPRALSSFYTGMVDSKSLVTFLHRESGVTDPANPVLLNITAPPSIEFRNVTFSYVSKGSEKDLQGNPITTVTEILKGISFTIKPGEKVAIVGPSGSGKSTIIKLLQRFNAVTSGEILINGIDIANVSAADLRENIALVSQETSLFSGTVLDNINYGDFSAGYDDVASSAKFAELREDDDQETSTNDRNAILHKDIGEQGHKLSGGQKQRTSIARALLKGGFVYLLDEATSALDAKTEADVQVTLDGLTAHTTTLVITHRLNTIMNADKIYFLDSGKFVEEGNFSDLMASKGKFYELFVVQCEDLGISVDSVRPTERANTNTEGFAKYWELQRARRRMHKERVDPENSVQPTTSRTEVNPLLPADPELGDAGSVNRNKEDPVEHSLSDMFKKKCMIM